MGPIRVIGLPLIITVILPTARYLGRGRGGATGPE